MSFINNLEKMKRLKQIECFVLDMDGTFNLGNKIIPGALDFYNRVKGQNKQIIFLTNNSSKSGKYYVEKLNGLGCPATKSEIYTSGMATCGYLKRNFDKKRVYLLGNEHLISEFAEFGINLVEDKPEVAVIGFDDTIDYEKMTKVCDYVRRGLPYIATHPDYNCPTETGFVPDIGAMIAFIKASTQREPDIIVGKPNGEIVRGLMELTGIEKEKMAICGDRLYTDIATGVNFGILSICVLTGEANETDIEEADVKPDLVFESLGEMKKYL